MKKPAMVLFDYGNTLIHEDPFDAIAGYSAVLSYAVSNPCDVTAEELKKVNDEVFAFFQDNAHCNGVEVHHHCMFRTIFDRYRLKFDIPFDGLETVFWDTAAPGHAAPGISDVLAYLRSQGIRTGVVSNISFSREAMSDRLCDRLPGCDFEFVVTSSEYGFRKPERLLFDAAIGLSGLPAEEIWFCGDTPVADVVGSSGAGMFPVLYRNPDVHPETDFSAVDGIDYLYITHWDQFIPALMKAE